MVQFLRRVDSVVVKQGRDTPASHQRLCRRVFEVSRSWSCETKKQQKQSSTDCPLRKVLQRGFEKSGSAYGSHMHINLLEKHAPI